ncbi:hypothetical protein [Streptomyces sp. NPDC020983]|uniref:hypothetical protein n=1 Tax=Streptomyces sp. NPDC020983 TaxID=3365106 RepID=UPI0037A08F37
MRYGRFAAQAAGAAGERGLGGRHDRRRAHVHLAAQVRHEAREPVGIGLRRGVHQLAEAVVAGVAGLVEEASPAMFTAARRNSSLLASRRYAAPPSKVVVVPSVRRGPVGAERVRANFAVSVAFSENARSCGTRHQGISCSEAGNP